MLLTSHQAMTAATAATAAAAAAATAAEKAMSKLQLMMEITEEGPEPDIDQN